MRGVCLLVDTAVGRAGLGKNATVEGQWGLVE